MKIHILAIAGTMTAPLAVALKKQGHTVTGSDQEKIYPPISTLLETNKISFNQSTIDSSIDLAIIGSGYLSFSQCLSEFEKIKELNIPYISATEYLAKNLIKTNSILVAGSYGKTTITSLLSWVTTQCGLNPNYFFGGFVADNFPSLKFTDSDFSVIEADESINGLDTQAKFLYYPVKYLILTSAQWEHKDSYSTAEDNFNAFKKLVQNLPANGLLVYNSADPEVQKLLPFCQAKAIPYKVESSVKSNLIGLYNQQNIFAVISLCQNLDLPIDQILAAVASFPGVKRRLEVIYQKNNLLIVDDFAQSAVRVKSAIDAIHYSYPNSKIYVYFEPHASFLKSKSSLSGFNEALKNTHQVILSKINFSSAISKTDRVTAKDWTEIVGSKLIYQPLNSEIISYFSNTLKPNDVLIHFSSGGLDGLNTLSAIIAKLESKTL